MSANVPESLVRHASLKRDGLKVMVMASAAYYLLRVRVDSEVVFSVGAPNRILFVDLEIPELALDAQRIYLASFETQADQLVELRFLRRSARSAHLCVVPSLAFDIFARISPRLTSSPSASDRRREFLAAMDPLFPAINDYLATLQPPWPEAASLLSNLAELASEIGIEST